MAGWSRSGADAARFEISSDGALSFKKSPNYESPADVGGDNVYNVTVNRSGGSLDVVDDGDERGRRRVGELGRPAAAGWSVGECDLKGHGRRPVGDCVAVVEVDGRGFVDWEDIDGATSSTYAPTNDEVGYYVQSHGDLQRRSWGWARQRQCGDDLRCGEAACV